MRTITLEKGQATFLNALSGKNRSAAAAVHQGTLVRAQQKVLNQLVMRKRGFEARIVPCHMPLPVCRERNFPKKGEPVVFGRSTAENGWDKGDSTGEVPVQKVKTAIRMLGKETYGVLSHVPSCRAHSARGIAALPGSRDPHTHKSRSARRRPASLRLAQIVDVFGLRLPASGLPYPRPSRPVRKTSRPPTHFLPHSLVVTSISLVSPGKRRQGCLAFVSHFSAMTS